MQNRKEATHPSQARIAITLLFRLKACGFEIKEEYMRNKCLSRLPLLTKLNINSYKQIILIYCVICD